MTDSLRTTSLRRICDVSGELLSIFSRRRDLLYQTAVLITAGSLLSEAKVGRMIEGAGEFDDSLYVSWFVFAASALFCMRFIQLHAGLMFNAMQFTAIEHFHFGGDLPAMMAQTGRLNIRGMSAQIILYLAVLTGMMLVIAASKLEISLPICSVAGGIVTILLIARGVFAHNRVVNGMLAREANRAAEVVSTVAELRQHYLSSLATAHSELICITALLGSLTFGLVKFSGHLLQFKSESQDWPKLVILSLCAVFLSVIAIRIYTRIRRGIINFCSILDLPYSPLFKWSTSDTTLGFLVLAFFTMLNLMVSSKIVLQATGIYFHDSVFLAVGGIVSVILVMWHQSIIAKLKSRASGISMGEPAIWIDSSRFKRRWR